jgi:hypothetical protein
MNDMTYRYCPVDLAKKLDADIHPWLLSEREGGNKTKLSYVKVDILTDTLNKLFGPLGWGVEAEIQKMEDFQYDKPGYQGAASSEMYVFQVISQVKLTIKPQTDGGTPTVFIQSGIGYGEVKVNAHRKDAVGMAVKGAESDGLKRCCNFLGRALGMFLVGGKQDPVTYAHNGNRNAAVVNRAKRERDDYEDGQRSRGRRDDHDDRDERGGRNDDRQDARGRDERGGDARRQEPQDRDDRQRDERPRSERSGGERGREEPAREDRARDDRQSEDRQGGDRGRDDQARDGKGGDGASRERAEAGPRQDEQQESGRGADSPSGEEQQASSRRRPASRGAAESGKDEATDKGRPEVKGVRKANTNYDLRKVPVTRENQQDFGATFIKQMEGMRQAEDQVQMVKSYAQRINELDPDVRALVVARLRERDVDVTLLD